MVILKNFEEKDWLNPNRVFGLGLSINSFHQNSSRVSEEKVSSVLTTEVTELLVIPMISVVDKTLLKVLGKINLETCITKICNWMDIPEEDGSNLLIISSLSVLPATEFLPAGTVGWLLSAMIPQLMNFS